MIDREISGLNPVDSVTGTDFFPLSRDGSSRIGSALQIGTYVVELLTAGSPTALDTWLEIVDRLEDDEDTLAALVTALSGKQPLDAMLTALAALTSANGKFLAFSGADAPVVRDIVGTVAQSGGVPTAAIIERGSNADGEYVRCADGTQICWGTSTASVAVTTASGPLFSSTQRTQTFPATFVAGSTPVFTASQSIGWITSVVTSPTDATFFYAHIASGTLSRTLVWEAVGRWF